MIDGKTLIQEYYDTYVKEKHPTISFEKTEYICRYIFKFIKRKMSDGTLKNIRLKYFGIFRVFPSNVVKMIRGLETSKYLREDDILKKKKMIKRYVENNPEKFKKYKNVTEEIEKWDIKTY